MSAEYPTKQIEFHGIRNILTQNINGPCCLLGLVNTLLLTCNERSLQEVHTLVALVNSADTVPLESLLAGLRDIAVANARLYGLSTEELTKTLSLLPTLHEGVNINPEFDGGFAAGDELTLFRVFNVGIVHGWVISPEDKEYAHVVKYQSYEAAQNVLIEAYEAEQKAVKDDVDLEIMEDAEGIKHFFARTATQLTDYGLIALKGHLQDNQIVVFFRNNHFNTIIKTANDIYQLVTDQGFYDKTSFVWESLLSINGANNSFFKGDFTPILEDNPFDDDEDRRLALEMQAEEDERAAAAMQKRYERTSTAPAKKEKEKKMKKEKVKRDKKCIIM